MAGRRLIIVHNSRPGNGSPYSSLFKINETTSKKNWIITCSRNHNTGTLSRCSIQSHLFQHIIIPVTLVVTKPCNALSQNQQGIVDVSSLLQTLSKGFGLVASLRTSQVTQRKPKYKGKRSLLYRTQNPSCYFKKINK